MASLTSNRVNPSASSNLSSTPFQAHSKSNHLYRHQHSHSTSSSVNHHFGSVFSQNGGPRSAGGPRQRVDPSKTLAVNGPISPRPSLLSGLRPNSEILSASHLGGRAGFKSAQLNPTDQTTEAAAIDKWFENLQSYDTTLEEMASASLDVNFKEELNAIEHWFRVLSEAERTAALYSLMQSSTQLQIRFFITVLQQMARSDPMIALLSPAVNTSNPSMEQQMEAKLSQLNMKSPASPSGRYFGHQLTASNGNAAPSDNFLSPHSALFNDTSYGNDSPSLSSTQLAKLGLSSDNLLSAPERQLSSKNALRGSKWASVAGPVEPEPDILPLSPAPLNPSDGSGHSYATPHPTFACTVDQSHTGIESQLSPAMGGSWASQVNTPLVQMFANSDLHGNPNSQASPNSAVDPTNRVFQWGTSHQAGSNASQFPPANQNSTRPPANGFPLDDARKFRRQSKVAGANGTHGFPADINTRNVSSPRATSPSINNTLSSPHNPYVNFVNTSRPQMSNATSLPSPNKMPLLGAQQAAEAAQQNWRNGLNSASAPQMSNSDLNNLGLMSTLASGLNGGMNLNGMANLAAMANITDPAVLQNMAQLLNMRQQVQQVQNFQSLQQQLQQGGIMGSPMFSPHSSRLGMNFSFPKMPTYHNGMGNRSNSSTRGSVKPTHAPGTGSNPDEELDMKLLNDIPAWLRGLRLHKYTPNFIGCTWQEMVLMSDATLEARGVAAVGARRKMLRTFETVRVIKGMALPGDRANRSTTPKSNPDNTSADQNSAAVDCTPTQSDRDLVKNDSSP